MKTQTKINLIGRTQHTQYNSKSTHTLKQQILNNKKTRYSCCICFNTKTCFGIFFFQLENIYFWGNSPPLFLFLQKLTTKPKRKYFCCCFFLSRSFCFLVVSFYHANTKPHTPTKNKMKRFLFTTKKVKCIKTLYNTKNNLYSLILRLIFLN